MDADPIKGLRQYLQIHVDMRKKHKLRDPSWVYAGMEDFVLEEGEPFTEFSPYQPVPGKNNRYRMRMPKACFNNAYLAAVASRGNLLYVEGYAMSAFMPVHHAWNIDAGRKIVDTTWCGDGTDLGMFTRPTPGVAYFGIVFDLNFVRSTRTNNNTCVIDQWEKNWPLLKQKFRPYQEVAA